MNRDSPDAPRAGVHIGAFPAFLKTDAGCVVLHCTENSQQTVGMGHVWTVPAVQEESDYQRSVRVRSCIRPVVAWRITSVAMQPLWPLALM